MKLLLSSLALLAIGTPTAAAVGGGGSPVGDWQLRIDAGGEIYFASLKIDAAPGDAAGPARLTATYGAQGRRSTGNSVRFEGGLWLVEVQTRQFGAPTTGLFAFELTDAGLAGDVDFEGGSGVRSYEFEGTLLGGGGSAVRNTDADELAMRPSSRDGAAAAMGLAKRRGTRAPETIRLRQGDASYASAVDTEVWAIAPSKALDRQGTMTTDANNGGGESQVLLRFGDLIAPEAGRVPPEARVVSAALRVVVFDPGTTVYLHRALAPWDAAATWDRLAAGLSTDGIEASPVREGFNFGQINMDRQEVVFDVTQSVQAWADGEANHGWVFVNTGDNGWDFYSSDWIEEDLRPSLEVTFVGR